MSPKITLRIMANDRATALERRYADVLPPSLRWNARKQYTDEHSHKFRRSATFPVRLDAHKCRPRHRRASSGESLPTEHELTGIDRREANGPPGRLRLERRATAISEERGRDDDPRDDETRRASPIRRSDIYQSQALIRYSQEDDFRKEDVDIRRRRSVSSERGPAPVERGRNSPRYDDDREYRGRYESTDSLPISIDEPFTSSAARPLHGSEQHVTNEKHSQDPRAGRNVTATTCCVEPSTYLQDPETSGSGSRLARLVCNAHPSGLKPPNSFRWQYVEIGSVPR